MNIEIRLATEADFDQVGNIFAEENQFHAQLVPEIIQVADPIMTHEWFDEVLNNPNSTVFVAEKENYVLGIALIELRTSIDDPIFKQRKNAHIREIAVLKEYQGSGIGRLLMERIHHWANEQDITEIELQVWERNTPAISFYEKLGFQTWRRMMRQNIDRR